MPTENGTSASKRKAATKVEVSVETPGVVTMVEAHEPQKAPAQKKPYKVRTQLDPMMLVSVKNGFQGRLVYISRKTGEKFLWEEYGDEQDMELQELKNARNSSKKFFANNWFMLEDPEVVRYLGVEQYYKNAVSLEELDELFEKPADELEQIVSSMNKGQQRTMIFRAKQLIADGTIDSMKTITALEKSLGVTLIEK